LQNDTTEPGVSSGRAGFKHCAWFGPGHQPFKIGVLRRRALGCDLSAIDALVGAEHQRSAGADELQRSTTEWAHSKLQKVDSPLPLAAPATDCGSSVDGTVAVNTESYKICVVLYFWHAISAEQQRGGWCCELLVNADPPSLSTVPDTARILGAPQTLQCWPRGVRHPMPLPVLYLSWLPAEAARRAAYDRRPYPNPKDTARVVASSCSAWVTRQPLRSSPTARAAAWPT